jgi:hypothetical protein
MLGASLALAQSDAASGTPPQNDSEASEKPAEHVSSNRTREFYLGVFGGTLNVNTDAKREIDKKGTLMGLSLNGVWYLSDAFASAGIGYLNGNAKGSNALTNGDQSAKISSPFVDLNVGYRFMESLSAAIGMQGWLNKGSDFSPEDEAEKNKIYYYAELGFRPNMTEPLGFNVRYLRDMNVEDRSITAITLGLTYLLPL